MNTLKKIFLIALLPLTIQFPNKAYVYIGNTELKNKAILKIGVTALLEPILRTILDTKFITNDTPQLTDTYTDKYIRTYIEKHSSNKDITVHCYPMNSPMVALPNKIIISDNYFVTIENILVNRHAYENNKMISFQEEDGERLENPHEPTSEELVQLDTFEFFIAHELGHIKNNDIWKSLGISLIKGGINFYAYYKIMQGREDSVKNTLLAIGTTLGIMATSKALTGWIPDIFQEKAADTHAYNIIANESPENFEQKLRSAQEYFLKNKNNWEKSLSDPKTPFPNIDGCILHKTLYGAYKLSGSTEPFMLWLKEKSSCMYNYIFMRAAPTHPTPMARIDAIEKFIQKHSPSKTQDLS